MTRNKRELSKLIVDVFLATGQDAEETKRRLNGYRLTREERARAWYFLDSTTAPLER